MLVFVCCALVLGFFAGVLSYLLDYALGFPMSAAPNPQAVFFGWTHRLSRKRLEKDNPKFLERVKGKFKPSDAPIKTDSDLLEEGLLGSKERAYIAVSARRYYKWEMMAGMCVVCTNVWVSVVAVIAAAFPLVLSGVISNNYQLLALPFLTTLSSHFFIRKIV